MIIDNDGGGDAVVIEDEDISEVPKLPEGDDVDWKAEATKYQGMATRRGTKLTKLKNAPKPAAPDQKPTEQKPTEVTPQTPKPGEFDYGQKAYLASNGYKEDFVIDIISKAVANTGRTMEQVISDPFVNGMIATAREEAATKAGIPTGNGGDGSGSGQDTVDYWLKKGGLPPESQVKLRREVVNARIKQQKSGSKFTSNPIVGNVQ